MLVLGKLASGTNTQRRQEQLGALATATVQQHRMGRGLHLSALASGEGGRRTALGIAIFSTALLIEARSLSWACRFCHSPLPPASALLTPPPPSLACLRAYPCCSHSPTDGDPNTTAWTLKRLWS